jgi:small subunit ribosomal protein S20
VILSVGDWHAPRKRLPEFFATTLSQLSTSAMPTTKSAKKRHRQSLVRRARNRAAKSVIKSQVRKVREAIAAADVKAAETEFQAAVKKLDKTAARGIVHPNLAARIKSRLSAAIKAAKGK